MPDFDPREDDEWEGGPIQPGQVGDTREEAIHEAQKDFKNYEDPSLGLEKELPADEMPEAIPADAAVQASEAELEAADSSLAGELPEFPVEDPPQPIPVPIEDASGPDIPLPDELPAGDEYTAPQSLLEAFEQANEPGQSPDPEGPAGLPQMPPIEDEGGGEYDLSSVMLDLTDLAEEETKSMRSQAGIIRDLVNQVRSITEALERMRL